VNNYRIFNILQNQLVDERLKENCKNRAISQAAHKQANNKKHLGTHNSSVVVSGLYWREEQKYSLQGNRSRRI
jgi:hypothetical protein